MAAVLDDGESDAVGVVATVTLFCGLPGAGKTSLARQLAGEGKGVRICTDQWQHDLGVAHTDADFHERLQGLLYRHALAMLRAGCDAILEDGLWRAEERAEKFRDARECGARIELHVFDVSIDELWLRLQDRNLLAVAGAAPMTRDDLETAWSIFQPPTAAELARVDAWLRHGEPPTERTLSRAGDGDLGDSATEVVVAHRREGGQVDQQVTGVLWPGQGERHLPCGVIRADHTRPLLGRLHRG